MKKETMTLQSRKHEENLTMNENKEVLIPIIVQ